MDSSATLVSDASFMQEKVQANFIKKNLTLLNIYTTLFFLNHRAFEWQYTWLNYKWSPTWLKPFSQENMFSAISYKSDDDDVDDGIKTQQGPNLMNCESGWTTYI